MRPPSRNWPIPSNVHASPLPQPKVWNEDIVISGISGRYPECSNLTEFWTKLTSGVELISCDGRRWPVGEYSQDSFLSLRLTLALQKFCITFQVDLNVRFDLRMSIACVFLSGNNLRCIIICHFVVLRNCLPFVSITLFWLCHVKQYSCWGACFQLPFLANDTP